MTPLHHLQEVCTEAAGWEALPAGTHVALVRRGAWTVYLSIVSDGWYARAEVETGSGHTVKGTRNPNPIHAITEACAAVVDELRGLAKGAP